MPYFTKEQEERAVALILKECDFCDHGGKKNSSLRSMSYVERDSEGYVVGLVDLGLQHLPRLGVNDEKNDNSSRQQTTTSTTTLTPRHWKMPPAIGYLTRLRKLTVYHCKSLPREIIHLSESLQEIAFHFCEELDFDALPPEFEHLQQLVDFRIHGGAKASERILPIHRLQNFTNLRYLYYRGGPSILSNDGKKKEEIDHMLHRDIGIPSHLDANNRLIQDLLGNGIKFKKSLEILEIEGGDLTEFTVARIFSQVLPQYPNLKRLILPNNKIRSLAPIISQQPPVVPPSVRLRCFYLMGNPVLDVRSTSTGSSPSDELLLTQPEQTNLLQLLSRYEEITSLGHGITESVLCTTEMLLALDLNDGGKILLSERFQPIPLSVWPHVLERASQRKGYYESTNVLYHLLRNGPTLGKRRETTKSSSYWADLTMSTATTTAADTDYVIGQSGSIVGHSLISQFPPSIGVVTPTTSTATMTTATRKRKISMP